MITFKTRLTLFFALTALLLGAGLFFNSCKKDDEIIEIHELDSDLISHADIHTIVWYDEMHAMRTRYNLISFTSDGGRTWGAEWMASTNRDVLSMVYPQIDTAYAFEQDVSDVDIYRTIDRGATWTLIYTVPTGAYCSASACARSAKKILCLTANASSVYKVYKTNNSGVNWAAGVTVPHLWDFFAPTDSIYFAISTAEDIWKTTNAGANFAITSPGNNVIDYVILPTVQKGFFVDESGVIYRSDDYGSTWHVVFNDPAGAQIHLIDADPSGLVFAAGEGAPLISKDFGETWNYYTFKDEVDENQFYFQFVHVLNSTSVVCYYYNREVRSDFLVKCTIP